jgi:inhibitor of cysteine peptidase
MLKKLLIILLAASTFNYATQKPIMLKVGQTSKIKLVSNPTTGYSWQIAQPLDKKDPITLEKTGFLKPKSKLIGAPTTQFWVFTGKKRGTVQITLEYKRPWETETPPVETKTFTFQVQ